MDLIIMFRCVCVYICSVLFEFHSQVSSVCTLRWTAYLIWNFPCGILSWLYFILLRCVFVLHHTTHERSLNPKVKVSGDFCHQFVFCFQPPSLPPPLLTTIADLIFLIGLFIILQFHPYPHSVSSAWFGISLPILSPVFLHLTILLTFSLRCKDGPSRRGHYVTPCGLCFCFGSHLSCHGYSFDLIVMFT